MRLELASYVVEEVEFGNQTRLEGRRLSVSSDELREAAAHPAISDVGIAVVRPGDVTRITQLSDVIEPRIKPSGEMFPGLVGPLEPVGFGRTNRLAGVALMVTGEVPWLGASGLFVPRDNFVDMAGPARDYTPYSQTLNIVLQLSFAEGFTHEDYQQAVVLAGARCARLLATPTRGLEPAEVIARDLDEASPDLPRVLYALQVQSQGVFMRTYLYGHTLDELFPTLLHPNEVADGALVAGGLGGAAVKLTTWLHQNNPLIEGLFARHRQDWNFAGLILHRGHYYQFEDKQRVGMQVARLAQMMRADGVMFSLGGGGNNITEVMLAIQACERLGIKTVLVAWEHGGPLGEDYPLPFAVPEAEAMVSTGTLDGLVELPAMERVVGRPTIRIRPEVGGQPLDVSGTVRLSNSSGELFGSGNPVGFQRTGCREW
jgi:glycine reductase